MNLSKGVTIMLNALRAFTRILSQGCDVLNNVDIRNVQKINY